MLKLINIKMTDEFIESEYIPENSTQKGYAKINLLTNETTTKAVSGYEQTYPRMALNGLRRTFNELKAKKIDVIPRERLVMWY